MRDRTQAAVNLFFSDAPEIHSMDFLLSGEASSIHVMMWSQMKGTETVLPKNVKGTKCNVDGFAKNSTISAEYNAKAGTIRLRIKRPRTAAFIMIGRKSNPKKFIRPVSIMPRKVPMTPATDPTYGPNTIPRRGAANSVVLKTRPDPPIITKIGINLRSP